MCWLIAAVFAGDSRITEFIFGQTFAAVASKCTFRAAKCQIEKFVCITFRFYYLLEKIEEKIPYLPLFTELHSNSSSPCGHCFLPSQSVALDTHLPLCAQVNDCLGHSVRPAALLIEHSSSEPSEQSGRPSHTKYQLMQWPLERHWNVSGAQPVKSAWHVLITSDTWEQSQRPSGLHCVYGSASWHWRCDSQGKPSDMGPSPKSTRVRISVKPNFKNKSNENCKNKSQTAKQICVTLMFTRRSII